MSQKSNVWCRFYGFDDFVSSEKPVFLCSQASETGLLYILKTSLPSSASLPIPRMLVCLTSLTPSPGLILTAETTVGGALGLLPPLRHPGILEET